ncbi:MAG: efflux RND transporter permease subunit [Bacteroidales bacterium]
MFELFIRRPILSGVISVMFVLLGLLALTELPITQFPDIVPPSVTVRASYTGANADVMTKTVATPVERAINGVPGMTYMTTVCTNDGVSLTTVYFKVGTDPDVASVNVQNRVTTVLDELPEEVIRAGVVTEKEVNSMLLYLNIVSSDPSHTEKFVYNFADINILRELKRIDGVGFAAIMGNRDYAMRVWLNPNRLATYRLSPQDVTTAIRSQNVEAAPGKTGISSDKLPQSLQYVLRYTGKFSTPEEYGEIVIKALPDGSLLRLKDIATIEFDSQAYNMVSMTDGRPSAAIMIKQRPGSNAREVINNIKDKMAEIKEESFAPGMDYNISYDVSRFLDASIWSVIKTLLEAFLLVFIVVYIFLQDFRSTMIPAIAVPVSLLGTFTFMQMMGFSVNLLTLFALVLAIGIVVDNAIVVVEAVHVKMHDDKLPPYEASVAAIKEIGSAIIAITMVMSAVFVPVGFMSGTVGVFYRQFSLTLAVAIVISGINALTLSPALCAMMLKPVDHHGKRTGWQGKLFNGFNRYYDAFEQKYHIQLSRFLGRRFFTYVTLILFIVATWGMTNILPTGFIPNEDQGMVYVNVEAPPGATLERSEEVLNKIQAALLPLDEVESVSTLAGYSLMTETEGANFGMGMINLIPWDDRDKSAAELALEYQEKTAHIKDAEIQFFLPPTVPGFGNASGFELRLLDKTDAPFERTAQVANELVTKLNNDPRLRGVVNGFNPNYPQYLLHIDLGRAAKMGIDVQESLESLQTYIGSFYSSNFIRFGQMYKVMLQASPEYRTDPENIFDYFAKDANGNMVSYSNFMTLERVFGPSQITRYNLYTSALITGDAALGVSSGQAIQAVEEIAQEILPRGYDIEWSGVAKEEKESGGQTYAIFAICLVFVYLLLAAQYESIFLPFPVILSLPAGVFGTYFLLKLTGLENNIYAQVALVMLIGLLGKNSILIIEMANQYRQQGMSIMDAAIKGAVSRLRPVLMTSFAFISGLIPLTIAVGAGALGNRSIGTAAAGGMFIGTFVGIFLAPGLYILFETLDTKFRKSKKKKKKESQQPLGEESQEIG